MSLLKLLEIVINILAAMFLAHHLIEVYGLPMRIKRAFKMGPNKRVKPFDCNYCLSAWMSVALNLIPSVGLWVFILLCPAYLSKYIK